MYRLYIVHTDSENKTKTEFYPNLTRRQVNSMIDKYCELASPDIDKNNNLYWQLREHRTDMTLIDNDTNKTISTSNNRLLKH